MAISINIHSFILKYMSVLPPDLFAELNKLSLQGACAQIPTSTIVELGKRLAEFKARDKALGDCARLNNKGIDLEKAGRIADAIQVYEENIAGDCYPATHSFDRLMVLYRKQKKYASEIRVIKKAIEIFTKENLRRAEMAIKDNPRKEKAIRKALITCDKVRGATRSTLTGGFFYCFCPYDVEKYKKRLEKAMMLQNKQSK